MYLDIGSGRTAVPGLRRTAARISREAGTTTSDLGGLSLRCQRFAFVIRRAPLDDPPNHRQQDRRRQNVIGEPMRTAMPATTMFALASNSMALPPVSAPSAKGPPHPVRLAVLADDLCHHRLILATWGCCSLVSTIADSTRTPEQDPEPASV
jgi:hypothetical protein